DPSKNVVARPAQPMPVNTAKKVCYVITGDSRIPQRCDRLSARPTTAHHMDIYGHRPGRDYNPPTICVGDTCWLSAARGDSIFLRWLNRAAVASAPALVLHEFLTEPCWLARSLGKILLRR